MALGDFIFKRFQRDTAAARTAASAAVSVAVPAGPVKPRLPDHVARKRKSFESEPARILALPVVSYAGADLTSELMLRKQPPRCPACGVDSMKLRDIQSEMLLAARHSGKGGLYFVGTGHGKAYVAILLGSALPDVDRVLVFAPSGTLSNLQREKAHLRMHFRVHPDVQLRSFERLQQPTPEGQLDYIEEQILRGGGDPARTLIVFDEAHRLKNPTSARGGRVLRCVETYPALRIFMLSGSLTDQSIKECAHLAWMALRENSPFPAPWLRPEGDRHMAKSYLNGWANCLDLKGKPNGDDWRALSPLWAWAYPNHPMTAYDGGVRLDMARKAFFHRLSTTPGVIMSKDTSLKDTALVIRGLDATLPPEIKEAISVVENKGLDPNGNVVPDFASAWRVKRQLIQGFYLVWDWPVDRVTGLPVRDDLWLLARSTWKKYVRTEVQERGTTGYDSEFLIYSSTQRNIRSLAETPLQAAWLAFVSRACKDEAPGVVSARERKALAAWHEAGGDDLKYEDCVKFFLERTRNVPLWHAWVVWSARHKHKQQPPTKAIWLSTYLVDDLMARVAEHTARGEKIILWYDFREMGAELGRRGIPVYGAGTEPPSQAITCALAIGTHSEGKNLQHWDSAYVICPPSGGTRWEQMLARLHRTGQKSAVVTYRAYTHVAEFLDAFINARNAAAFVQSLNGSEQKILHATLQDIRVPRTAAEMGEQAVLTLDELDEILDEAA